AAAVRLGWSRFEQAQEGFEVRALTQGGEIGVLQQTIPIGLALEEAGLVSRLQPGERLVGAALGEAFAPGQGPRRTGGGTQRGDASQAVMERRRQFGETCESLGFIEGFLAQPGTGQTDGPLEASQGAKLWRGDAGELGPVSGGGAVAVQVGQ